MASIFARDLAGLTSAEIAQQQADTQQRAVDLAYLAQIANASVTRAGDMGRERVGMRTTDNSRDVGMRSADVTDRGLTLRRESDLGQRDVDRYRIDAESARAQQENLNRLAIAIKQAEMQQAATAAANAQRMAELNRKGEIEKEMLTTENGQINPKLFDIISEIEAGNAARKLEQEIADEARLNASVKREFTSNFGFGNSDDEDREAIAKAYEARIAVEPNGTNRFSVIRPPGAFPEVRRKPDYAPGTVNLEALMARMNGTKPAPSPVPPPVEAPTVFKGAKQPRKYLSPDGKEIIPQMARNGMIVMMSRDGVTMKLSPPERYDEYVKSGDWVPVIKSK